MLAHSICILSVGMGKTRTESKSQSLQEISAAQMTEIVRRSGLSRDELAQQIGCGTSQLFKYEKEGLPPRMNREVRAAILQLGVDTEVLAGNAVARATISKLSKEQLRIGSATSQAEEPPELGAGEKEDT